jgi:hypothetical protein
LAAPPAHRKPCCTHKPAKRARAKSQEQKAAAQLDKAQRLLNAGKRQQAVKRLLKIVGRYPKTKAAAHALIILSFTPLE